MFAPDAGSSRDQRQRYATIVVVGGGCYGGYYHRQIQRAAGAGALVADRVLIVDRDPECSVARLLRAPTEPIVVPAEVRVQEWSAFFEAYLTAAALTPERYSHDTIVPSPLMPHLMGEWLVGRARARAGSRVSTQPLARPPAVPWERAGGDGTHYVSFATWMCPINCIEPHICPHTRGERTWSMPVQLQQDARAMIAADLPVAVAVLHCEHRAYGVGMFDTAAVVAADELICDTETCGGDVIIGTVSHCHGALIRLVISPPNGESDSPVR